MTLHMMRSHRVARAITLATMLSAAVLLAGCAQTAPAGPGAPGLEIVSQTAAAQPGVTMARLSNGLTVIVAENKTNPVVDVRAYVKAGSMYEGPYLGAGISHILEHLVAEGAEEASAQQQAKLTPGSKPRRLALDRIGGQSNAYTSSDRTCYYISAAAGKTNDCIDLVAQWMTRPSFTVADFQREHGVVQREIELGEDNPDRHISQAHMANCYGDHPAAAPVIGYKPALAALTYKDVVKYHRTMYVPQNMVMIVAGDVNTTDVLDRIRRQFAPLPAGRLPNLTLPEASPVAATRRMTVTHKALTDGVQHVAFQTIPLLHDDLYPLDVLSEILTTGETSRLVASLQRRDRLVLSIDSSSWTPEWGRGWFEISFRATPDKLDQAEAALLTELRAVVEKGVTDVELQRAKRQKVVEHVRSQQTVGSQAGTLGSDYLATGSVGFSDLYTQRIGQVTAEQVLAVARKYFDFGRMVITRGLPAGQMATTQAATQRSAPRQTVDFTLPNGLRVVLTPAQSADLVSMVLVTKGGLMIETPQTNGMGTLMTALSAKGAGGKTAEEIAAFFDSAGGRIGGSCGTNSFVWQATVMGDSFKEALPLFADVIQRPTYPDKELQIIRPMLLSRIRQSMESWESFLNLKFREDFFGKSPLALNPVGAQPTVADASPPAIADYHKQFVKAGSSVLSIFGNFDPAQARGEVERLFAAMPAGQNQIPEVAPRKVTREAEKHVHAGKLQGAGVIVASPGMKITDLQDRLAMSVLDTIISGYRLPRGWLHDDLRGRKLVYVVHAYNFPALAPGAFVVYAHCEAPNADLVAGAIRDHLRRTTTYAFTQEEVDEAVNIILTSDLLDTQDYQSLAMQAALDELYGFGYDYRKKYEQMLRRITRADVSAVARKYLGQGFVTVMVKPEAK